jgi:ABC-type sugar transport system ATPase subunit
MTQPFAQMLGITKRYPGVTALESISIDLYPGEVHALAGENGAGKSTLIKVLAGIIQPEEGELIVDGETVEFRSPAQALELGIRVVHQELACADHLSVTENILLGQLPSRFGKVDWRRAHQQAREKLDELGIEVDEKSRLDSLSLGQQQLVEIARALMREARILILDEPSAILGKRDLGILFDTIRSLRERGVSIVYISHRLDEVFELADRITVLKDGSHVGTWMVDELDVESLVEKMTGRELVPPEPRNLVRPLPAVLEVSGLTRANEFEDVSFVLGEGEIVGIAGMVGAGRSELARAIAGATRPDAGEVRIRGEQVRLSHPRVARRHGVGLLPEDRKAQGLLLNRSIRENIGLASLGARSRLGVVRRREDLREVTELAAEVDLRYSSIDQLLRNLSGGNQQKVLLARWLAAKSDILILDEPTRGVDVGGKSEIYRLMRSLSEEGVSILMISSEIEEIVSLSDRVLVMRQGRLVAEFEGEAIDDQRILRAAIVDTVGDTRSESAA